MIASRAVTEFVYDRTFFDIATQTGAASARRVVPFIAEWLRPESVVDVGCGEGVARRIRNGRLSGRRSRRPARRSRTAARPRGAFVAHDLEKTSQPALPGRTVRPRGLPRGRRACVADARGRASRRSRGAVRLRSLLQPRYPARGLRPGEQPHEYWVSRFEDRGYASTTVLRRKFAAEKDVASWYRANLLLFVRVTQR